MHDVGHKTGAKRPPPDERKSKYRWTRLFRKSPPESARLHRDRKQPTAPEDADKRVTSDIKRKQRAFLKRTVAAKKTLHQSAIGKPVTPTAVENKPKRSLQEPSRLVKPRCHVNENNLDEHVTTGKLSVVEILTRGKHVECGKREGRGMTDIGASEDSTARFKDVKYLVQSIENKGSETVDASLPNIPVIDSCRSNVKEVGVTSGVTGGVASRVGVPKHDGELEVQEELVKRVISERSSTLLIQLMNLDKSAISTSLSAKPTILCDDIVIDMSPAVDANEAVKGEEFKVGVANVEVEDEIGGDTSLMLGVTAEDLISEMSSTAYTYVRDAQTSTTSLAKPTTVPTAQPAALTTIDTADATIAARSLAAMVKGALSPIVEIRGAEQQNNRIGRLHNKEPVLRRIAYDLCCLLSPIKEGGLIFGKHVVDRITAAIIARSIGDIIYAQVLNQIKKYSKMHREDSRLKTRANTSQYSLDPLESMRLQSLTYACHSVSFQVMKIMTELEEDTPLSDKHRSRDTDDPATSSPLANIGHTFLDNPWKLENETITSTTSEYKNKGTTKLDLLILDISRTDSISSLQSSLGTSISEDSAPITHNNVNNSANDWLGEDNNRRLQAVQHEITTLVDELTDIQQLRKEFNEIKDIIIGTVENTSQEVIDREEEKIDEIQKEGKLRVQAQRILDGTFANAITIPTWKRKAMVTIETDDSSPLLDSASSCPMTSICMSVVAVVVGVVSAVAYAASAYWSRQFTRAQDKEWLTGVLFVTLSDTVLVKPLLAIVVALFFTARGKIL